MEFADRSGDTLGMRGLTGIVSSVVAALVLAALSTVADWIWATWIPVHRPVFGLIHGALLFMCLGLVLGLLTLRPLNDERPPSGERPAVLLMKSAGGELLAGLAAAALFYALFGLIGWTAMFLAWMAVWIFTAFVSRWIRVSAETLGLTVGRGMAAAILSGAAFWAISGIWLGGSTRDPVYLVNFASWFVAFLPGFLCLLLEPAAEVDVEAAP